MISTFTVVQDGQEYTVSVKPIAHDVMPEISLSALYGILMDFGKSFNVLEGQSLIINDPGLGFLSVTLGSYKEEYFHSEETLEGLTNSFSLHVDRLDADKVPVNENPNTFFISMKAKEA